MNAQSVWVGHSYAHVWNVKRGVFPNAASKVKVKSIRKIQQYGKTREDTFATVTFEDEGIEREVNVRNLYDFWDSYQDEKKYRDKEREEKRAAQQAEADERERQRLVEVARKRKIGDNLAHRLGIDPSVVRVTYAEVTIELRHLRFLEEG